MYWIEEETYRGQSAVGLVQMYPDHMASMMKHGAFVMYSVHAVCRNLFVNI